MHRHSVRRSSESYPLAYGNGPSLSPEEPDPIAECRACHREINFEHGEVRVVDDEFFCNPPCPEAFDVADQEVA